MFAAATYGGSVDDFETIRFDREGDVLVVTIDRPGNDVNAIGATLHEELGRLFRLLKREQEARAILLTGSKRAFTAGGDFEWFPELRDLATLDALRRDAKQLIWDLLDVELPIVAALNGPAVGLGASIALLCDVIVMADTAVIADPHVKVGIVAGDGGAAIWPLLAGPAIAKQYLLTGDPVPAAEAARLGLVNEVVPAAEVRARGLAWAARLAAGAPLAVRATKLAVNQQVKRALLDSFDLSTALEITTFLSADHREALAAHQERRTPRFEGR
jgi:enoyl-CoA hydratase